MTTNEAKLLKSGTKVTHKKESLFFRGMTNTKKGMKLSKTRTGKITEEDANPAAVKREMIAPIIGCGVNR